MIGILGLVQLVSTLSQVAIPLAKKAREMFEEQFGDKTAPAPKDLEARVRQLEAIIMRQAALVEGLSQNLKLAARSIRSLWITTITASAVAGVALGLAAWSLLR